MGFLWKPLCQSTGCPARDLVVRLWTWGTDCWEAINMARWISQTADTVHHFPRDFSVSLSLHLPPPPSPLSLCPHPPPPCAACVRVLRACVRACVRVCVCVCVCVCVSLSLSLSLSLCYCSFIVSLVKLFVRHTFSSQLYELIAYKLKACG